MELVPCCYGKRFDKASKRGFTGGSDCTLCRRRKLFTKMPGNVAAGRDPAKQNLLYFELSRSQAERLIQEREEL